MRLRRVEPYLRAALRGPCALPRGARLLVAVSGGADSTALCLGLARLAPEFGLSLRVAHLHHGLRGTEADQDLEFVAEMCGRLGLPFASARWKARERMRRRGLSGENGLRVLRREFLRAAADACGASAIATAHTADDQLETVLMRLMRGTGLHGLGGMSPRRGVWIKPLLAATRHEIELDLRAAAESWREDLTNLDTDFTRNRVRHVLVPALLETLRPGDSRTPLSRARLARRFARAAGEAREAEAALERWIRPRLPRLCRIQDGEIALDSKRVATYPSAIQRTMLRVLWKRFARAESGLTQRHLQALQGLIRGRKVGAQVGLPDGWAASRTRGGVRVRRTDRPGRAGALRVPREPND